MKNTTSDLLFETKQLKDKLLKVIYMLEYKIYDEITLPLYCRVFKRKKKYNKKL